MIRKLFGRMFLPLMPTFDFDIPGPRSDRERWVAVVFLNEDPPTEPEEDVGRLFEGDVGSHLRHEVRPALDELFSYDRWPIREPLQSIEFDNPDPEIDESSS